MLLREDDRARVTLRTGTCVLVPYRLFGRAQALGVARIEAVLQVGCAHGII